MCVLKVDVEIHKNFTELDYTLIIKHVQVQNPAVIAIDHFLDFLLLLRTFYKAFCFHKLMIL